MRFVSRRAKKDEVEMSFISYNGKLFEEMTREELIAAIKEVGTMFIEKECPFLVGCEPKGIPCGHSLDESALGFSSVNKDNT